MLNWVCDQFSKKRSLGFAHLFRPRYPDFLHGAPPTAACAAFIKESRMKFANASKLDRKSEVRFGEPGVPVDSLRLASMTRGWDREPHGSFRHADSTLEGRCIVRKWLRQLLCLGPAERWGIGWPAISRAPGSRFATWNA